MNDSVQVKVYYSSAHGYVAVCHGQRTICSYSHEVAARGIARKCYGDKANIRPAYLMEGDVMQGVMYRYCVIH